MQHKENPIEKDLKSLALQLREGAAPRKGSLDGFPRSPEAEARLDQLAYATFSSPAGKQFLNYLRQITVNHPLGPDVSDSSLRHKEGMRFLFGLIYSRYEKGKDDARR